MKIKNNQSFELVQANSENTFYVKLHLSNEIRNIGKLDLSGEGTFSTQRNANHLFRKSNSLGINAEIMTSKEISFKWIVIDYQSKKLVTTRNYFLQKGKTLCFNNKSFEPQIFLPLAEFGIEKVREYETNLIIQPNLFNEVA